MNRFIASLFAAVVILVLPRVSAAAALTCTSDADAGNVLCTCDTGTTSLEASSSEVFTSQTCNDACNALGGTSFLLENCEGVDASGEPILSTADQDDVKPSNDASTAKADATFIVPVLNVQIPGLTKLSTPTISESDASVNFLAEYIVALYGWVLGAGALVAVVMMMLGGLQYVLSRGKSKYITKAKTRITNAITGLILLLAAYNIAFLIDPSTVNLKALTLKNVAEIQLDESVSDDGGSAESEGTGTPGAAVADSTAGSGENWKGLQSKYLAIVQAAKDDTAIACKIPDLITSPVNKLPNQGNHHWYDRGRNGDYKKINAMDWAAPWGNEIKAPFAGTVTYEAQKNTANMCGNRIYITAAGGLGKVTICHAKNFLNASLQYVNNATVAKGDVIGHLGGVCCAGQTAPSSWITQCTTAGTACTDPTTNQNCSCQPINMAGNTTGPHVHMTFNYGGNILSCMD